MRRKVRVFLTMILTAGMLFGTVGTANASVDNEYANANINTVIEEIDRAGVIEYENGSIAHSSDGLLFRNAATVEGVDYDVVLNVNSDSQNDIRTSVTGKSESIDIHGEIGCNIDCDGLDEVDIGFDIFTCVGMTEDEAQSVMKARFIEAFNAWDTVLTEHVGFGIAKLGFTAFCKGHEYETISVTNPTWTKKGKEITRCPYCGDTEIWTSSKITKSSFKEDFPSAVNAEEDGEYIIVSWDKVNGASKYEVYESTNGKKYTRVKTTSGTTYKEKYTIGQKYYFKVRGYAKPTNKTTAYTGYSKAPVFFIPFDEPCLTFNISGNGVVTISYDKIAGAKQYEIYMSVNGGSYKLLKRTSSTKYTQKNLKHGYTYSYKARAVNGKNKGSFGEPDGFTFE